MYVPSLELGLPHPFSRKPAAKGVGESQFQRLEKRLALCLLCGGTNWYALPSYKIADVFLYTSKATLVL